MNATVCREYPGVLTFAMLWPLVSNALWKNLRALPAMLIPENAPGIVVSWR